MDSKTIQNAVSSTFHSNMTEAASTDKAAGEKLSTLASTVADAATAVFSGLAKFLTRKKTEQVPNRNILIQRELNPKTQLKPLPHLQQDHFAYLHGKDFVDVNLD